VPSTYFGLCTVFNVLVSVLVVGRLVLVRRRVTEIIGKFHTYIFFLMVSRHSDPGQTLEPSRKYTNVTAIFIESYALIAASYLAVAIAAAITALEGPVYNLFLSINLQMEVSGTETAALAHTYQPVSLRLCLDDCLLSFLLSNPIWARMDKRDRMSAQQATIWW
jgi:hypothetical protein